MDQRPGILSESRGESDSAPMLRGQAAEASETGKRVSVALAAQALAAFVAPLAFAAGCMLAVQLLQEQLEAAPLRWWFVGMQASAGTLLIASGIAYHIYCWRGPLRRLRRGMGEIRAGRAAIDELSRVKGPLAGLSGQVQDLLRELRFQKVQISMVNQEMRQRVAQRTDALERLVGSLRQQANRDPLTGLYNRRMLDQHLQTLIDQSQAGGEDLCLLMMDLDNFKLLNDTVGHAAGDELLRTIGQIIRSTIRDGDLAFRCGGDEFVIVMPGHGAGSGEALSKRLVSLVDELAKTVRTPRPLGLSVGLATLKKVDRPGVEELMREADRELYEEKKERKRAA